MATLAQKIEAEKRMRDLLEEGGLPQPDYVEYGYTCIRLFFMEPKLVVVVDIDDPEDVEASIGGGDRVDGRRLGVTGGKRKPSDSDR
jgi:hypothetical protein